MGFSDRTFYGAKLSTVPFFTGQDDTELPIKGGRSSIDENDRYIGIDPFSPVSSKFPFQLLYTLENLSIYNRHLSFAVENIVTLGNTPYDIEFSDEVSDDLKAEMTKHIRMRVGQWYEFSDGENGLINDLLTQVAVFGAVSAETEVHRNILDGVKRIHRVHVPQIRFFRDKENDLYLPLQKDETIASGSVRGYRQLNTRTYSYIAIQRFKQEPYAVPPMLASIEDIKTEDDMMDSFKFMMKKLGMLGIMSVLVGKPSRKSGEDIDKYESRLLDYLKKVAPEVNKGFKEGITIGYKDNYDFQLQGTNVNAQGSSDLMNMVKTQVFNGLKQDPNMLGHNMSTTETFGRVLLAKMSKKIHNYQNTVAKFLERAFILDLMLSGFNPGYVKVRFDSPMITDQKREAETEKINIENVIKKRNQNIIDQNTAAIELGYDEPAGEAPLPPQLPSGTDPTNDDEPNGPTNTNPDSEAQESIEENSRAEKRIQTILNKLGANKTLYDYEIPEGCVEEYSSFTDVTKGNDARIARMMRSYLGDIKGIFDTAISKTISNVKNSLESLRTDPTKTEFRNTILLAIFENWDQYFQSPIQDIVGKNVSDIYQFYRKDKSVFKDGVGFSKARFFEIPEAIFSVKDSRAIEFLGANDNFYLGKFITDPDIRKRLVQLINENYLSENFALEGDDNLDDFMNELKDSIEFSEWKARRIIQTTVNNARNFANVRYMDQAQIERYEVVEVNDSLTCDYCKHMNGKTISIQKSVKKIDNIINSTPEEINRIAPFVTKYSVEEFTKMDEKQIENSGITSPSYHPHCRGRVVAVIE